MSMTIYAGAHDASNTFGPVIEFQLWERTVWVPADPKNPWGAEGEFLDNPHFCEDHGLEVSNANGYAIADALGFAMDDEGMARVDIDAAHKAVMRALALTTDAGVEPSVSTGALGARMVDCGRRPGYLDHCFAQLLRHIVASRKLGATHLLVA